MYVDCCDALHPERGVLAMGGLQPSSAGTSQIFGSRFQQFLEARGKESLFFNRAIAQVAGGDVLDPIPWRPQPLALRAFITQDRFPQTLPNSCFPVWLGGKKG